MKLFKGFTCGNFNIDTIDVFRFNDSLTKFYQKYDKCAASKQKKKLRNCDEKCVRRLNNI